MPRAKSAANAAKTATTKAAMATAKETPRAASTAKTAPAEAPADTSPDLEAGKAVAEANKEALDTTLTPDDGRDIEALRDERADLLKEIAELEERKVKAMQDEADEAGLHEAKIDDAGAAEQQKAARDSGAELYDRLGILTGPPVVAPIVEEAGGKFKIVSRREGDKAKATDRARFVGFNLAILGEGFTRGEVIIDIKRANGQDHQRFSTMSEDGSVDVVLPGITGTGDYLVHLEQLVTQVGEGREDHLPLIHETAEKQLELY